MNQRTLQTLFVVSWAAWACMPLWGLPAFLAVEVLLLAGLWGETKRARARLNENVALAALEPGPRAFLGRHALVYAAPATAKGWASFLRAVGLALLLLVPAFAAHALLRKQPWLLAPALGAVIGAIVNGSRARPLELDEWVKDPAHAEALAHHLAIKAVLAAQASAVLAAAGAASGPGNLRPPPGAGP